VTSRTSATKKNQSLPEAIEGKRSNSRREKIVNCGFENLSNQETVPQALKGKKYLKKK